MKRLLIVPLLVLLFATACEADRDALSPVAHSPSLDVGSSTPTIEDAILQLLFGVPPDGEFQFYHPSLILVVEGDFNVVDPIQIAVTLDGGPAALTLEEVFSKPTDWGGFELQVRGSFNDGVPRLGRYEVTITDGSGNTSASHLMGELVGLPEDAPRLAYPGPAELVEESEPTFVWEHFDLEIAGELVPRDHYVVSLLANEGWTDALHIPPDVTSVEFQNEYWTPYHPEPLEPGVIGVEMVSMHVVEPSIHLILHRAHTFIRTPETLIINPQNQELSHACPIPADYIAQDEAALRVALSIVQPGEVIGIDGMIELGPQDPRAGIRVTTDDVTLTCASPGSGLRQRADEPVHNMVYVESQDVSITHLVLDGSGLLRSTVYGRNDGGPAAKASALAVTDNEMICGPWLCVFTLGVADGLIADNKMVADGSTGGAWIQGNGPQAEDGSRPRPTDGTRFLNNTVTAVSPITRGVRIRDGGAVMIRGNDFNGPVSNPVFISNLRNSVIELNRARNAATFGLLIDASVANDETIGSLVKNNQFNRSGAAGVFVNHACGNTFIGNNVTGNPDGNGLILDVSTGANAVNGVGKSVIDNGELDCDGDGVIDPNVIAGSERARTGVKLGPLIRDALQRARDVQGGEIM